MSQLIEVKVPDIGDFDAVPVIELFVKVGDTIKVDDAIATLESDKATMDVPSSAAGVVKEVLVNLGDRVSEGAVLIKLEAAGAAAAAAPAASAPAPAAAPVAAAAPAAAAGGGIVEVKVPDIGDFSDVPVIELFVKVGDSIKAEDAIATLESDKATMDVPSSATGVVKEVLVQLGSRVSEGAVLIKVETGAAAPAAAPAKAEAPAAGPTVSLADGAPAPTPPVNVVPIPTPATTIAAPLKLGSLVHASPSVRAFAREHNLYMISIADMIRYRRRTEKLVRLVSEARIPTMWGDFTCKVYESVLDGEQHVALVKGDIAEGEDTLVRVHSECLTGDVFGSMRCDCGVQLDAAMKLISEEGSGVIVYLRGHEGRGIGIGHKIRAYNLQEQGMDTIEANVALGLPVERDLHFVAKKPLSAYAEEARRLGSIQA